MNHKTQILIEKGLLNFLIHPSTRRLSLCKNAMKSTLTYRFTTVEVMNEHTTVKLHDLCSLKKEERYLANLMNNY